MTGAEVPVRHGDLDGAHRLEQPDARCRRRLLQSERAGDLERGVAGVDPVRLAVDEADPHVDQRSPRDDPLLGLGADPLLHRRDVVVGDRPTDDLVDELEAGALGQRLDLDRADGVLAVPAGLLDVPAETGAAVRLRVARSGTRTGSVSTSTPCRVSSRSSSTSACASPMHHSTSWPVSALRSSRTVGSSAASRASPVPSLSSSERERALTATGSSGSGSSQASIEQRVVLVRQRVAGLGRAEPGDRADVAGPALGDGPQGGAERRRQRAGALVDVVVRVVGPVPTPWSP